MNQFRILGDEIAQSCEIASIQRGYGVGRVRMRRELRDPNLRLDCNLQIGPVAVAVLARDHQLRIGERQRTGDDILE